MRLLFVAASAFCALGFAATALSQSGGAMMAPQCVALPEALRACAPTTCAQPHPFMRGFAIEHEVAGAEGDTCAYNQTMPGGVLMVCRFSESGRARLRRDR